jgi:hypothetical protein
MNNPGEPTPLSEPCPTVETLRAFARGQLTLNNLSTVVDHLFVKNCRRCGELLLAMPETTASALAPPPLALLTAAEAPTVEARRPPMWVAGEAEAFRGLRLGRYLIRDLVGKGGFGAVYAARDEELHRDVAVKVPFECGLRPEQLSQVKAEARLHASLDHPNILPIYDIGETPDVPVFFVSKLIRGQNLALRAEQARLSPREAAGLLVPLASALDHMRRRGLVHRDVKPRNVLIDEQGTPYLTDFGLAMQPSPLADGAPERLLFAGTLPYMSPEQARGEVDRVDHRTDVYALGVILYELLTGERPFRGDATTLRERIVNQPPVPPRQLDAAVPGDLEAVCLKALAKAPADRYQEAGQLGEDLECWLRGEPPRHAGRSRLRRAGWWLRRNAERAGWAALALLALALVGWVATRPPPPEPPPEPPPDPRVPATVRTEPPGASVSYFPLHETTGEPQPDKVVRGKEGEVVKLHPGHYLIVAVSDTEEGRFHEVFRTVPGGPDGLPGPFRHERWGGAEEGLTLPVIRLPRGDVQRGMALFPAATEFVALGAPPRLAGGGAEVRPQRRRIPAFWLDTAEVRADDFRRWSAQNGEAANLPPDHAAVQVWWGHAAGYAEKVGKRLADEFEFEFAATDRGKRQPGWRVAPDPRAGGKWTYGPVGVRGADTVELPGQPPVHGLCSNVAEWTTSWAAIPPIAGVPVPGAMARVVRGGSLEVIDRKADVSDQARSPWCREALRHPDHRMGLGFRCARSAKPRWDPEDFGAAISSPP